MNPVEAIHEGLTVILPTDTVYGLACSPYDAEPVARLYALKGRDASKPTAIVAGDLDALQAALPELDRRVVEAYLPGPYTLVVPNPARRFPWLTGSTPEAIGVRVPELPRQAAEVLAQVGAVCATSANAAGGSDPRRLDDVPAELRAACGAVVDAGELPGVPSTVIDLTGSAPRVLREGARPPQ